MDQPADLDPKEYMTTLGLLKEIDFLKGVPEESLKGILFNLQKQTFGPKKTILFQGEIANRLFILRKGDVHISTKAKTTRIELAHLKAPAYFGEISLLTPTSATATVQSGEAGADLLILTHDAMSSLSKRVPDIAQRIKQVIETRVAAKKQAKAAEESED